MTGSELSFYEDIVVGVPERFGATTYRYTIVNDRTVLVDPRSRRIMQVVQ